MKKLLISLFSASLLILAGCGSSMTVVEYNDSFIAIVNECLDATQPFWNDFEGGKTDVATLQDDIDICKKTAKKASDLGDFDGDNSLKNAVSEFLNIYVEYLEKFTESSQYRNVEEIQKEDESNYKSLVKDLNTLEESLNTQMSNLQEIQSMFANKHGLKLQ